jgi:hypothetical protein
MSAMKAVFQGRRYDARPKPSFEMPAPALDVLIVPIGGGGLIAGIAVAASALKPGIERDWIPAAVGSRTGLPRRRHRGNIPMPAAFLLKTYNDRQQSMI